MRSDTAEVVLSARGFFQRPTENAVASSAHVVDTGELALDTVAAILRTLGEFALDQPNLDAPSTSRLCEQWAQHITLATPAPGSPPDAPPSERGRREWAGLRAFVRDYAEGATGHARTVAADLRQVIWVFIQNLAHTLQLEQQADDRIKGQLGRLEKLAMNASPGELKKEVLSTVVEVSHLVEERRKMSRARLDELGSQVRSLGHELDAARRDSETDPLTKLFNRRAFDEYLRRSVELANAFGHESCLLMVDVDKFKAVNDGFGHAMGDLMLKRIADTLSRVFLRKSDFVARYAGDEFAVVLRETNYKDAFMLGDRVLKAVRALHGGRDGFPIPVSVSVGVARLEGGDDAARWLERADKAMYGAKQAGRNQVLG